LILIQNGYLQCRDCLGHIKMGCHNIGYVEGAAGIC